jgi:hypothetical protein
VTYKRAQIKNSGFVKERFALPGKQLRLGILTVRIYGGDFSADLFRESAGLLWQLKIHGLFFNRLASIAVLNFGMDQAIVPN